MSLIGGLLNGTIALAAAVPQALTNGMTFLWRD